MPASTGFEFYDHAVFHWVNRDLSNAFFNWFFPAITDLHKTLVFRWTVIPVLAYFLVWKRRLEGCFQFFGLLLTLAFADYFGGKVIKPFFVRLRPPQVLHDVILRAPEYGGYSFTSNHASNMFCFATFLGFFFPRLRPWLLFVAILIAFSRVYCGVHFPADVIVGAAWGSVLGGVSARFIQEIYYLVDNRRSF